MSSQKDKFLASAQKYIQKGQFDRALRDYEQVVTADPKDVKLRQKLAELMIRCNRREDAIREYNTIAKFYDENGFYLKSIAVYKQIQRLDPSNIEISLCLATLNEKQGMIGNALSEYKLLYDHYQKNGQIAESIEILQKMQAVDPENVDIRLKLAETLYSAELKEKAYQEFTRAALALKNRGNSEFFDRVSRKIHDLFPEKTDTSALDFIEEQLKNGMVGDAVSKLQQILADTPDSLPALGLLSDAYRLSNDVANQESVLKRMLELCPDDIFLQKALILCLVEAGDLENSIVLIDRYLPGLFSANAYGDVEHYYTTLQNLAPYDLRLLQGLKNLYELTGESSKLADVQVSLNILSQKDKSRSSSQAADAADDTPEDTASDFGDSPWGDEIDLALCDEVDTDSGEGQLPADSLEFGSIDLSAEDVTTTEQEQEDFEIDISFEFPDDGVVFQPSEAEIDADPLPLDSDLPRSLEMEEALPADVDDVPDFLSPEGEQVDTSRFDQSQTPPLQEEQPDAFDFCLEETELSLTDVVPELPQLTPFGHPELIPSASDSPQPDTLAPDDIFSRFKDTPKQDYEQGDTETHYNLGIAYIEMGLHDEAIKEFRISANDPDRKLDSLTLQGLCFRDQGNYGDAEELFTALLSLDALDSDRILALRYELGLLYEAAGRQEEALQVFREIFGNNPGFRDTMQKIAFLSGKESSFDLSDLDDADIELEELV
ncbi:MAG: tetratricopeptide repeat protein [Geobacteraceae bacterium]|nr:tetratricopeptide repeat protein [Geobacteraceae bacterium]